jgi:hypothetical protein
VVITAIVLRRSARLAGPGREAKKGFGAAIGLG